MRFAGLRKSVFLIISELLSLVPIVLSQTEFTRQMNVPQRSSFPG